LATCRGAGVRRDSSEPTKNMRDSTARASRGESAFVGALLAAELSALAVDVESRAKRGNAGERVWPNARFGDGPPASSGANVRPRPGGAHESEPLANELDFHHDERRGAVLV